MPKTRHYRSDNLQLPRHLSREEVQSAVAKYFCRGFMPAEIAKRVYEEYGVEISREDPARILSYLGQRGRLQYVPPLETDLQEKLSQCHPWLGSNVRVVHSMVADDVAYRGAKLLVELMQNFERGNEAQRAYHIGFAGGHLLRKVARSLASLLREAQPLPKRVVFHALVAGFDLGNPITAPNSFFSFFGEEMALPLEIEFVGLNAPGIVRTQEMEMLKRVGMIERAFKKAKDIDVIYASAGHWEHGHSVLHQMYELESKECLTQLLQMGCVGDMMWRPVGRNGPLETDVEARAVTIMNLSDVPSFIARGKSMVLVVGPCGVCRKPKNEVLEPILAAKPALLTHLVIDSLTATRLLR